MTKTHEIDELEFGFGPRLWDADPDVCCAAFQLGACAHTESAYDDYLDALEAGDIPAIVEAPAQVATLTDDEPF